jgi:hypothetical protein
MNAIAVNPAVNKHATNHLSAHWVRLYFFSLIYDNLINSYVRDKSKPSGPTLLIEEVLYG